MELKKPTEMGIDALTGLPNRQRFDIELKDCEETMPGNFSLLFIDLDGLKRTNDIQGHLAGDALVISAANALRKSLRTETENNHENRESDTIALGRGSSVSRIGGDEFPVILKEVDAPTDLLAIIDRISDELENAGVSASIGAATHNANESAADTLARADAAMQINKEMRKEEAYNKKTLREKSLIRLGKWALKKAGVYDSRIDG